MHRFFVSPDNINNNYVTINGEDVAHLSKVLRLREGEHIIVCDSNGTDYECCIESISKNDAVATIVSSAPNIAEPPINITIYQGLPKSDKMDYIIQKCVELGANKIVPVITKRAVAIPRDGDKKILRWQRIANEAAKQCGRGILPLVGEITDFKTVVETISSKGDLNIIPYENEKSFKLKQALTTNKNINILIGPEGGFDPEEIDIAMTNGIHSVTLGPRILRTETAPLAVVSAIMYAVGDW